MNWQTALILFAMVSPAIVLVMIAYLAWKGIEMALLGKAYRPTFILIAAGIVVIGIAVWVL
jgi:hypothetical protein